MKPVKVLYFALICSAMILLLNLNAYGQAKVTKEGFGKTPDGQDADIYTLTNSGGAEVKITNYGGIVTSLRVPDRNGKLDDIVLGFDNLDAYLKGHPYWSLWKSHRQRPLHAARCRIQACCKQRREPSPRRHERV